MSARFVATSVTTPTGTWWIVDYSEDGVHYHRVPLPPLDQQDADKVARFLNQYVDKDG